MTLLPSLAAVVMGLRALNNLVNSQRFTVSLHDAKSQALRDSQRGIRRVVVCARDRDNEGKNHKHHRPLHGYVYEALAAGVDSAHLLQTAVDEGGHRRTTTQRSRPALLDWSCCDCLSWEWSPLAACLVQSWL
ncbi:hypothetical protein E2C01_086099 [Portunus trituberculatus]|uniref:Uncharacterized protein n=1 Tax=Portunus trituberculatus TaxID=210409 RepID=A0A5B7JFF4_PORTR|nr:hypothetical protein [Portunus trituberculatus]